MEQYTTNSNSSTEQIVVQAGQIQQQQGGVTAVQLQTEAQVASASGQQVQTLQVVVPSLIPCEHCMNAACLLLFVFGSQIEWQNRMPFVLLTCL